MKTNGKQAIAVVTTPAVSVTLTRDQLGVTDCRASPTR